MTKQHRLPRQKNLSIPFLFLQNKPQSLQQRLRKSLIMLLITRPPQNQSYPFKKGLRIRKMLDESNQSFSPTLHLITI